MNGKGNYGSVLKDYSLVSRFETPLPGLDGILDDFEGKWAIFFKGRVVTGKVFIEKFELFVEEFELFVEEFEGHAEKFKGFIETGKDCRQKAARILGTDFAAILMSVLPVKRSGGSSK